MLMSMPAKSQEHRIVLHKHKNALVTEAKLGRYGMDGCIERRGKQDLITLDPRLASKRYLTVLIHEHLHRLFWEWPEEKVVKVSTDLASAIWKANYRRIRP